MDSKFKRVKYACYTTNLTMSVVGNLSPLLFLTVRELYDISFSLLGLLVLVNFTTQLLVDLAFSFFSHKFNIPLTVKLTPAIAVVGLLIYSLSPILFPGNVYLGIIIGTVIFSASAGLAEVLISPVIAAIPSKNPEREMSKLHSIYAWGVVGVVVFATVFLLIFKSTSWQWLSCIFMLVPLTSSILFMGSEIPEMEKPEKLSGTLGFLREKGLWLCVFGIFLGGAAECTMGQWASGYLEEALGIEKIYGDIFGVAMFGATLGLGRSLYAKFGKNISKILLLCAIGATVCYFVAAISPVAILGLVACALCGFCTSMLWPGNLVVASDRFASGGVVLYALMAAGGDLGASVAPQLVGIITDVAVENPVWINIATDLGLTPGQFGMKLGLLIGMLFPLVAIPVYIHFIRIAKRKKLHIQEENTAV